MNLQHTFSGTGIAIITPFTEEGAIDWADFKRCLDFWMEGGVEYLVVLGTTGESATIHGDEKQAIFTFVQQHTAGRIPLVAGIGGNDTQEVIHALTHFDLTGYTAILSVSPYYNKPNQEGIFQHYKLIDQYTPLPIIIYNVPGRTGQSMTVATQLRIAKECKSVFATKEASGNMDLIMQLLRDKPADFMVISGDDPITLPMIATGASGVISVVANAFPKEFSNMVRYCLAGDFEKARPLHNKYLEMIAALFTEGSPAGIKAVMSMMGLCKNKFRLPVWPVSQTHQEKIKTLLDKIGHTS
ncbi:MAG: 4-hydroxy-tetrahydrodipicolinate synthase [Bacteroidetes bacterium]|nr:4-hydroxy-tetrahydrodipicolinate synthase [Bacteroidota bacterium]